MADRSPSPGQAATPSITATTVRRTIVIGRLYLGIAVAVSLVLTVVLLTARKGGTAFPVTFPLLIPLFAVLGSTGGLLTFTSDRTKGVFEYLIAYGIPPRSLFFNGLISTIAMSGIILGLSLTVGLGGAIARGVVLDQSFVEAIGYYTVPISFAGALFTSTVGMIWSTVSTPSSGINSPVGIAPIFGIAPVVLVLVVAESAPASEYYYVTGGAALAIIVVVVVLLAISARLMGRERFLSPL
jgi:hypothetical protein